MISTLLAATITVITSAGEPVTIINQPRMDDAAACVILLEPCAGLLPDEMEYNERPERENQAPENRREY